MVGKLVITGAIVAAALLLAACGSGSGSGSGSGGYYGAASSPSPSTAPVSTYPSPVSSPVSSPAAARTTIKTASSRLGQLLDDPNGTPLYPCAGRAAGRLRDAPGSACTGAKGHRPAPGAPRFKRKEVQTMPQKQHLRSVSDKEQRMYEHIKRSELKQGRSTKRAKAIAAATVV